MFLQDATFGSRSQMNAQMPHSSLQMACRKLMHYLMQRHRAATLEEEACCRRQNCSTCSVLTVSDSLQELLQHIFGMLCINGWQFIAGNSSTQRSGPVAFPGQASAGTDVITDHFAPPANQMWTMRCMSSIVLAYSLPLRGIQPHTVEVVSFLIQGDFVNARALCLQNPCFPCCLQALLGQVGLGGMNKSQSSSLLSSCRQRHHTVL